MTKVAVITGSSASGLACMQKLLGKVEADLSVRGCFRSQGRAATIRSSLPATALANVKSYEVHSHIDANDKASLCKALEGVDRAMLVTPLDYTAGIQEDAAKSINMVRAALEMGVKRIVHVGSWTVNAPDRLPILASRFAPTEEFLKTEIGDKIEWTVLRGGYFMSNFEMLAPSIIEKGEIFAVPDCKIPAVDVRDIGEAAAALLGGDHDETYATEYHKKCIECCGPQLLSHAEIAAELGAGIGKGVSYPGSPKLSDWAEQQENPIMLELFKYMADDQSNPGAVPFDPDTFEKVLGRPPTSLRQWAEDHKYKFSG